MIGSEQMRELERMIMLQIIDSQWKDHLLNIDHLKEGIGLRGYAQKDPLVEYKKESFRLFEELQTRIDDEIIKFLFLFRPVEEEEMEEWKRKKKTKLSRPTSKMPSQKRKKKKKKRR
jgi:preprotein translocase subunit SecA